MTRAAPASTSGTRGSSRVPDTDVSSFLSGFDISTLSAEQQEMLRKSRSSLDETIRVVSHVLASPSVHRTHACTQLKQQYASMYRDSVNKYKAEVLEHLASWEIAVPQGVLRRSEKSGGRSSLATTATASGRGGLSQRTRDVISKATQRSGPRAGGGAAISPPVTATGSGAHSGPASNELPSTAVPPLNLKKSRSAAKLRSMPETVAENEDDIYHRLIQPFSTASTGALTSQQQQAPDLPLHQPKPISPNPIPSQPLSQPALSQQPLKQPPRQQQLQQSQHKPNIDPFAFSATQQTSAAGTTAAAAAAPVLQPQQQQPIRLRSDDSLAD